MRSVPMVQGFWDKLSHYPWPVSSDAGFDVVSIEIRPYTHVACSLGAGVVKMRPGRCPLSGFCVRDCCLAICLQRSRLVRMWLGSAIDPRHDPYGVTPTVASVSAGYGGTGICLDVLPRKPSRDVHFRS